MITELKTYGRKNAITPKGAMHKGNKLGKAQWWHVCFQLSFLVSLAPLLSILWLLHAKPFDAYGEMDTRMLIATFASSIGNILKT